MRDPVEEYREFQESQVAHARGRVRLLRAYDAAAVSAESALDCADEPCIVQQQFLDECDVNVIVRRFGISGPPVPARQGVYGDFTGLADFGSAFEAIERLEAAFASLPAEIREKAGNDPRVLADLASRMSEDEFANWITLEGRLEDGRSASGAGGQGSVSGAPASGSPAGGEGVSPSPAGEVPAGGSGAAGGS